MGVPVEPQPEVLKLPGGADPARVRAFVSSCLQGHAIADAAARLSAALAADTELLFSGRPCVVTLAFASGTLRITVTAILPEVPAPRPVGGGVARPIDIVLAEGVLYGAAVSQRKGTSTLWVELPWGTS